MLGETNVGFVYKQFQVEWTIWPLSDLRLRAVSANDRVHISVVIYWNSCITNALFSFISLGKEVHHFKKEEVVFNSHLVQTWSRIGKQIWQNKNENLPCLPFYHNLPWQSVTRPSIPTFAWQVSHTLAFVTRAIYVGQISGSCDLDDCSVVCKYTVWSALINFALRLMMPITFGKITGTVVEVRRLFSNGFIKLIRSGPA